MKANTTTHEAACLLHHIQSVQCRMVTCLSHLEEAITSSMAVSVVSGVIRVVLTTYSWPGIRLCEVQGPQPMFLWQMYVSPAESSRGQR